MAKILLCILFSLSFSGQTKFFMTDNEYVVSIKDIDKNKFEIRYGDNVLKVELDYSSCEGWVYKGKDCEVYAPRYLEHIMQHGIMGDKLLDFIYIEVKGKGKMYYLVRQLK